MKFAIDTFQLRLPKPPSACDSETLYLLYVDDIKRTRMLASLT